MSEEQDPLQRTSDWQAKHPAEVLAAVKKRQEKIDAGETVEDLKHAPVMPTKQMTEKLENDSTKKSSAWQVKHPQEVEAEREKQKKREEQLLAVAKNAAKASRDADSASKATAEMDSINQTIRRLTSRIAVLEGQLAQQQFNGHVFQPVVMAKLSGETTWHEQTVIDGEVAEFTDGRACGDSTKPSAIIDPGENIFLLEVRDGDDFRYVHMGSRSVMVRVAAAASGGGKYTGKILTPPSSDTSASGTLSDSDAGDDGDSDALILNFAESGQSTHDLTVGTPVSKVFPGVLLRINSDGTRVIGINGYDFEDCPEA